MSDEKLELIAEAIIFIRRIMNILWSGAETGIMATLTVAIASRYDGPMKAFYMIVMIGCGLRAGYRLGMAIKELMRS